MDNLRISYLFKQLEADSLTKEEREELNSLLRSFENNDDILSLLENSYHNTIPQPVNTEHWRPILEAILKRPGVVSDRPQADAKVIPFKPRKTRWVKWIAAACIILVTGYGLWVMVGHRSQGTGNTQVAQTHDVPAPKETRAVITLANGQKVYLDSANNGTIAQENNVSVVKNEKGEIIYSHEGAKAQSEIAYNTLSNPRGSKVISLTLSDGTKVWLNSESSLKYPIAFNSNTREVEITGEAYFEVKHNAKQPFKVHLPNGSIVEDIGTSFNINAYTDEADIKTTLIEGSVRVSANSEQRTANSQSLVLKPDQQAVIIPQTRVIRVQNDVDVDKITAWKNNEFNFSDDDMQTIMRQLARWYNIHPVISGTSSTNYTGRITRDVPLSKVLEMFEKIGYVKFVIDGNEVKVVMK